MTLSPQKNVIFSSDAMNDTSNPQLVVSVNPDQIQWTYKLNTATYPTYGGEVLQILSMVFDNLQVSGQVQSYGQLEEIYGWFASYMLRVSQHGNFQDNPVLFEYATRNWQFSFWPTEMPGFKYGRDIVGPLWSVKGVIHETKHDTYQEIKDAVTSQIQLLPTDQFNQTLGFVNNIAFGSSTADIGYNPDNPFSGPTNEAFSTGAAGQALAQEVDWWRNLVPAYHQGRFPNLHPPFSAPAIGHGPPITGRRPTDISPNISGPIGDNVTKFFPQATP